VIGKPSLHLLQPLLVGSNPLVDDDVLEKALATYRRTSLAMGGDFRAQFNVRASDFLLETWFNGWLMGHFEEWTDNNESFVGYVHSLNLSYNNLVLSRTVDDIYNQVYVRYKTSSSGSDTTATAANDTDSQAIYGTRTLFQEAPVYMNAISAGLYRNKLLADFKLPRVTTERLSNSQSGMGVLNVELRGYIQTLDAKLHNSSSTATDDASDEIRDAISGADFVTSGTIDTNTLAVVEEADYERVWPRIRDITTLGDASSNRWLLGCYQGRTLNYQQADISSIAYYVYLKGREGVRITDSNGAEVPASLVQPGQIAFVADVMPAVPQASTLLDDPRAIFIEALEFQLGQVSLQGTTQRDSVNTILEIALNDALGDVSNG